MTSVYQSEAAQNGFSIRVWRRSQTLWRLLHIHLLKTDPNLQLMDSKAEDDNARRGVSWSLFSFTPHHNSRSNRDVRNYVRVIKREVSAALYVIYGWNHEKMTAAGKPYRRHGCFLPLSILSERSASLSKSPVSRSLPPLGYVLGQQQLRKNNTFFNNCGLKLAHNGRSTLPRERERNRDVKLSL